MKGKIILIYFIFIVDSCTYKDYYLFIERHETNERRHKMQTLTTTFQTTLKHRIQPLLATAKGSVVKQIEVLQGEIEQLQEVISITTGKESKCFISNCKHDIKLIETLIERLEIMKEV